MSGRSGSGRDASVDAVRRLTSIDTALPPRAAPSHNKIISSFGGRCATRARAYIVSRLRLVKLVDLFVRVTDLTRPKRGFRCRRVHPRNCVGVVLL